jgi:hypothetical protein
MKPGAATYIEEGLAGKAVRKQPPQPIDGTANPGSVDGLAIVLPVLTELEMAVAVL